MPSDPGPLQIRNQRYPRWFDMIGGMVFALILFGALALFFIPQPYDRRMALLILGGLLGLGLLILYGLFQLWDLRRPVTTRLVTARTLFEWLVLGMRRKALGPADGWTALTMLRPSAGSRYSAHHLKLGEGIEVEGDFVVARFGARAVARLRFAPDPREDYVGCDHPTHFCEATVEMDSGRQFCLVVTEADGQRLRQWGVAKGITVCDCDGYTPRPCEPPSRSDDPDECARRDALR
jgi:hypothetical protein